MPIALLECSERAASMGEDSLQSRRRPLLMADGDGERPGWKGRRGNRYRSIGTPTKLPHSVHEPS